MAIQEEQNVQEKDPRLEFLSEFTLKSLRLKSDKWARLMISDEQRTYLSRFIDYNVPQVDTIIITNTNRCRNYLHLINNNNNFNNISF